MCGTGLFLSGKGNTETYALGKSSTEVHPWGGGDGWGRIFVTEGILGPGEGRRR